MAALVIANTVLLRVMWSGGGRSWQQVFAARGNPGLPVVDQGLADALSTAWGAQMSASGLLPLLSTGVTFTGLAVRDISAANKAEFISAAGEMAGTGLGDLLPLSVAACVTLRTAGAGKSFRGRTYFSGFIESENDASGRQAAAVNTAVVSLLNNFNTQLGAHTLALAVASRPADAVTIPAISRPARTGQSNPVTSIIARNTKWESQRRRTGRT
jgi:hypothetical protein